MPQYFPQLLFGSAGVLCFAFALMEWNVRRRLALFSLSVGGFSLVCLLPGGALAQPPELPAMHQLGDGDKFQAAMLPRQEVKQILAQIEKTSFDWPDSWDSELRTRRVSLGDQEGLIVQGTSLLCGGTGNCQTWIFRRLRGRWTALFESQAPVIAGFGFLQKRSNGIRDLVAVTNAGGDRHIYTVFIFDGSRYRERQCYERTADGKEKLATMTSVPCTPRPAPTKP